MRYLDMLRDGETAVVESVGAEDSMGRRLKDLGFVPGTKVECMLHAPSGDPAAYRVRGASVALRRSDAARIGVR